MTIYKNKVWWAIIRFVVAALIVSGQSVGVAASLVDIANDENDPLDLADTEPSIAVNPKDPMQIAVVTFSEPWGPGVMAPVWKSNDGGMTWRKVLQIPEPAPGIQGSGDQKIAFDANGKLFVAELGLNAPLSDFIYRQTGGPDAPLMVGKAYGDDQPHLDIDKSSNKACPNRVYSPWLNVNVSNNQSMDSNSVNDGSAMTDTQVGDNSVFPNRTTRIALSPDGKAYITYKTREGKVDDMFEQAHFWVKRSDDCGSTWNALGASGISVHGQAQVQTFFTTSFGNAAKGKVARARSSDAWIAVGQDGSVYVAYVQKDQSGFGQIYVARSTDNGLTWNSIRVTDGKHHSAFPEIAVVQDGEVGILYIDFDDSGANTIFRHHFATSGSFNTQFNVSPWVYQIRDSMDPSILDNAYSGFLWGDYEGLTALGNTFYGVFIGQSIGRKKLQLDPIFFKVPSLGSRKIVGPLQMKRKGAQTELTP